MSIRIVSVLYAPLPVMEESVKQFYRTANQPFCDWHLVCNMWPLSKQPITEAYKIHDLTGGVLHLPGKNLGGHDGASYALRNMGLQDDDLILLYDLDSNPLNPFWLRAMEAVMEADPSLGYVSLHFDGRLHQPTWKTEEIAAQTVGFCSHLLMWGVTLFRGHLLKDGMKGQRPFYGFVENEMEKKIRAKCLRNGYLMDYHEGEPAIPLPEIYTRYKQEHGLGNSFLGSFEEYLVKHGQA